MFLNSTYEFNTNDTKNAASDTWLHFHDTFTNNGLIMYCWQAVISVNVP